jgi:hypothetical protein
MKLTLDLGSFSCAQDAANAVFIFQSEIGKSL